MSVSLLCLDRHLLPPSNRVLKTMTISLLFAVFWTTFIAVQCDESPSAMDDLLTQPSGKRQHNIMRFGKRPSPSHNLIRFGKREDPQSLLGDDNAGLLHFLQGDDNSYKRGHTIMRFGKRKTPDSHNFIRFGRNPGDKSGHSMMYFGKRAAGHNMMYFGKRAGHSMLYFGKRDNDYDQSPYVEESVSEETPSLMYSGEDEDGEEAKRASHAMIHFGKRLPVEEDDGGEVHMIPDMSDKRNHNMLRFGKKADSVRTRGSHAMIHFGKRNIQSEESRPKRSILEDSLISDEEPGFIEFSEEKHPETHF